MQAHKHHETPAQNPAIPMVKITPSYIVGWNQYQGERKRHWQNNLFTSIDSYNTTPDKKPEKQAYRGEVTDSSRKKLAQACDILFALAKRKTVIIGETGRKVKFRISLVTLTLSAPQNEITDREIKKELLEPFLRIYRKKGLVNYIWKAELQKNGNIHFHILSDCWFDKNDLTNTWNRLQAKLGFIEKFFQENGHRKPPSTNVKAVRTDKGIQAYLLKYMLKKTTKDEEPDKGLKTKISNIGKVWDCAIHLKTKNNTAEPIEDHEFELIENLADSGKFKKKVGDHCTIYFPVKDKIWNIAPPFLANRIIRFLAEVRQKGLNSKVPPDI